MLREVIDLVDALFRRSRLAIAGSACLFHATACDPVDEPSRLEQRARVQGHAAPNDSSARREPTGPSPVAIGTPNKTPKPELSPPAPAPPAQISSALASAPLPASQRVTLALALDPSVVYRTSVVGMVTFPMSEKPTGYAREETVRLRDCTGTGTGRQCTLTHRFTGFEAEPPAGRFLRGDYDRVAAVHSRHPITATGRRPGPATLSVAQTSAHAAVTEAQQTLLADVHRLFCIRFPDETVGVGAKWSDTCRTITTAGEVGKRDVTWELTELVHDATAGRRATLTYVGRYTQSRIEEGTVVERAGTIRGTLYFFVDAGQPHLMREKIEVPLGRTGVVTETSVNIQFAREDPSDPQRRLRTDGEPFPPPPSSQPPPAPPPDAAAPIVPPPRAP